MSVLIRGGRIVTAADDYVADLYIEDETIALIGESLDMPADRVIDAAGKYVLPGCVDPHTHLDMPFGGTVTIDDVESGQTAAAFGGTTCHVDFVIQPHGQTFAAALDDWRFAHRMPTRAAAIRELMKRGMAVHLEGDGASRVGRRSRDVRLVERRPIGGNGARADGAG